MPEAITLREVILDSWTGVTALRIFGKTREIVEGIIGAGDNNSSLTPKDISALEVICIGWLNTATIESLWLTKEQYREK